MSKLIFWNTYKIGVHEGDHKLMTSQDLSMFSNFTNYFDISSLSKQVSWWST